MNDTLATAIDWETECKRMKVECDERAKMCKELHAQCEELQRTNNELKATTDVLRSRLRYADGVIDGLKYATRCNGVSGAEVKE